jgi:hypothetical protein
VGTLCRLLGVSRSGYYAWRTRSPSAWVCADQELTQQIRVIHQQSRGTNGAPRLWAELRDRGVVFPQARRPPAALGWPTRLSPAQRTAATAPYVGLASCFRPRAARFRRSRSGSLMGGGHHLRADLGGVSLSRRGARRPPPAHRRLGDGRSPPQRTGHRSRRHGGLVTPANAGCHSSLRPGKSVHEPGLRTALREAGLVSSMGSVANASTTRRPRASSPRSNASCSLVTASRRGVPPASRSSMTSKGSPTCTGDTPHSAISPLPRMRGGAPCSRSSPTNHPSTKEIGFIAYGSCSRTVWCGHEIVTFLHRSF